MQETGDALALRIGRLERRFRAAATIAIGLGLVLLAVIATGRDRAMAASTPDVLRVRELDVVDPHGVTRVKLAAPLPNAVVDGRKLTRGGGAADTLSGMLLFDADGVERSGYATSDRGYSNVLLTLDDKHQQHAMFIAEPTGATTLRMFNGETKDRVDVAIDADGPSITLIKRGQEIGRLPAR